MMKKLKFEISTDELVLLHQVWTCAIARGGAEKFFTLEKEHRLMRVLSWLEGYSMGLSMASYGAWLEKDLKGMPTMGTVEAVAVRLREMGHLEGLWQQVCGHYQDRFPNHSAKLEQVLAERRRQD